MEGTMAIAHLPMRGKLYNVVAQLLKFLLMPLAVYEMALSTQLQIKLPATLALVDATPEVQHSREPSFNVAFYGLHFFASYEELEVRVSLVHPDGEEQLPPQRFKKKRIPFYSTQFGLPGSPVPGKFSFRYAVAFDGRGDRIEKTNKTYVVNYTPPSPCENVILRGPLSVRRGQRVALPTEWEGMDLVPFTYGQQVAIETHDSRKWLKAQPSLGEGTPTIEFQSLMLVTNLDQRGKFITTRNGQTQNAGPVTYWKENPLVCSIGDKGRGTSVEVSQILPNSRIAFEYRLDKEQDGTTRRVATRIIVAPAGQQTADVKLGLVVSHNEPPRSAYDQDVTGEVTLYTSWLFGGDYFNLNRYIIDPDGQNARTFDQDVRVSNFRLRTTEDSRFELIPPQDQVRDFRLRLRQTVNQIFQGIPAEESISLDIVAGDEVNDKTLTLKIFKLQ
jgi:hypothetical protein